VCACVCGGGVGEGVGVGVESASPFQSPFLERLIHMW